MRFFLVILYLLPQVLVAQNAPQAHFVAANTAICDSTYSESFTDQSTNNPTSWKWYFSGATPDTSTLKNPTNIVYNGYGCYTVKLVVKNNYGSDSLIDSNYICLNSPPNITLTGSLRVCVGDMGRHTIYAHGGTSYLWFNGDTTSYFIFYDGDNIFNVGVTVYNGACFKDTIFPLGHDTMPVFYFRGDTSICIGEKTILYAKSIRGYANYRYLWSTGSTTDSIVINGITLGSNIYYLTVTNGACIKDSSEIAVKVNDCTGIEDYNAHVVSMQVYPNPTKGAFTLQINSQQPISNCYIEIYDALGQESYKSIINAENIEINLSGQPQGIYLYRIISQTGGLISSGKFILEK